MTISLKEMLEIPGSQYVGGNVVIGERTEAKVIASSVDGIFGLTDEGREYFKQVQEDADNEAVAGGVKAAKAKKSKDAKPPVIPPVIETPGLDETPPNGVQTPDSVE